MIKRWVHQEEIIILNVYISNKLQNSEAKTDGDKISRQMSVGDVNIPHSAAESTTRQKISNDIKHLTTQ